MKIVCLSDTHEKHKSLTLPEGDLLIHAGDFTWAGKEQPTVAFLDWFEAQPFKHKILVSGNHDFYFQDPKNLGRLTGRNFHYLMNEEIRVGGLKIWGSPFTPEFMDWAFMGTPAVLRALWNQIPDNLDILITHGPPLGILDKTTEGIHAGCRELLSAVEIKKPRLHVFGHIHEGFGMQKKNGTTFVNASVCDADYNLRNKPVFLEWESPQKTRN